MTYLRRRLRDAPRDALRRLDARRVVRFAGARLLTRARLLLLFLAELRDEARRVVFRATFLAAMLHLLFFLPVILESFFLAI